MQRLGIHGSGDWPPCRQNREGLPYPKKGRSQGLAIAVPQCFPVAIASDWVTRLRVNDAD
ncbi:hypothetical protein PN441_09110 [Spirulina major CS-329]|uniref:hypothetical protein n=1 Tax=Spirulina TaxID=1154 RepID=UPI00232F14CE|nr:MULTISPECIES: hypothetical protein [Spirulina]MDB9493478.1 hypothetical protein [Spirulina subsalsa CS-330]MDB9503230.1 hypothetical protein [Spirulina major CS-329]